MNRILSFILAMVICLVFSLPTYAMNSKVEQSLDDKTSNINVITQLAVQHLANMRIQLAETYKEFGFNSDAFLTMSVGAPFKVHSFDESGQVISNESYSCPLIYNDDIVGVIGVHFDAISSEYTYSIGRTFGPELNALKESNLRLDEEIVIGQIADKLIATDGNEVKILFDYPLEDSRSISIDEIKGMSSLLKANVSICSVANLPVENNSTDTIGYEDQFSALWYPNPLPVPHVEQGSGVCGIAAWATVLNYRFSTSYTTSSLTTVMTNAGYNNTSGTPSMTHYRDFANAYYNAGCIWASSPPMFLTVTAAIGSGKPIMGSWYSGSGASKVYHAIIISGCIKNGTSNYTYYLKNPWYTYAVAVTTSTTAVVYPDGAYTWNLSQVVY